MGLSFNESILFAVQRCVLLFIDPLFRCHTHRVSNPHRFIIDTKITVAAVKYFITLQFITNIPDYFTARSSNRVSRTKQKNEPHSQYHQGYKTNKVCQPLGCHLTCWSPEPKVTFLNRAVHLQPLYKLYLTLGSTP